MIGGCLGGGYSVYVGSGGTGVFVQSGGTIGPSNYLYIGYNAGDSGAYFLYGGQAGGTYEDVGYSGTGSHTQTGGTNSPQMLYIGCNQGSNGAYSLGGGALSTASEYVGAAVYGESPGAVALLQQTGGVNSTGLLFVGSGGTLQLSGGTLGLTGSMVDLGVLDGAGGSGVMSVAGSSIVDLSRAGVVNAGSMSVSVGELARDRSVRIQHGRGLWEL